MQDRLRTLLIQSKADKLTPRELQELNEYERIEHLIVMIKAGNLSYYLIIILLPYYYYLIIILY